MVEGINLRFPKLFTKIVNRIIMRNGGVMKVAPNVKINDSIVYTQRGYEDKLAAARSQLKLMGIEDIKPLINLKKMRRIKRKVKF